LKRFTTNISLDSEPFVSKVLVDTHIDLNKRLTDEQIDSIVIDDNLAQKLMMQDENI